MGRRGFRPNSLEDDVRRQFHGAWTVRNRVRNRISKRCRSERPRKGRQNMLFRTLCALDGRPILEPRIETICHTRS
jgi:hypothetical protein